MFPDSKEEVRFFAAICGEEKGLDKIEKMVPRR